MLTSTPKMDSTTHCPKTSSLHVYVDTETGNSLVFGVPLCNVTDVENHQLCVDSSSDADTVVSKYIKFMFCTVYTRHVKLNVSSGPNVSSILLHAPHTNMKINLRRQCYSVYQINHSLII